MRWIFMRRIMFLSRVDWAGVRGWVEGGVGWVDCFCIVCV